MPLFSLLSVQDGSRCKLHNPGEHLLEQQGIGGVKAPPGETTHTAVAQAVVEVHMQRYCYAQDEYYMVQGMLNEQLCYADSGPERLECSLFVPVGWRVVEVEEQRLIVGRVLGHGIHFAYIEWAA